ncbi:MAG: hypothetical protein A2Y23_12070 [Clostridiales bacterium GWB2_37_7]|nr:MAG: hypothetical protein A2Y23_12070 [Clostridiales bacterium GWB2_37_7]
MKDRYIYLVFTKTGTWLSNLIYIFSNIKYAHASLSFDKSFTKMYSFGRTNPENPFSGGFVVESLYDGVYKKFLSCECMIYRVPVTEEQYCSLHEQVKGFIKEKDKLKYNFLGLFGILFNMPLNRQNSFFCSQFVSKVLIESKVFECDKTPELIRTDELFSISNGEMIYEGYVNNNRAHTVMHVLEG